MQSNEWSIFHHSFEFFMDFQCFFAVLVFCPVSVSRFFQSHNGNNFLFNLLHSFLWISLLLSRLEMQTIHFSRYFQVVYSFELTAFDCTVQTMQRKWLNRFPIITFYWFQLRFRFDILVFKDILLVMDVHYISQEQSGSNLNENFNIFKTKFNSNICSCNIKSVVCATTTLWFA